MFAKQREMGIVEIPWLFQQIRWKLMKCLKHADGRWSCNCWYSLGNTHIPESICQILSDSKNASRSKSRGVGEDFVSFYFVGLRRRRVQTMASKCDFVDFWASRVRGVEKMKKNRLLAGEVSSSVKIAFPRRVRITKNNESHAAWECQKWFMRHL